MRRIGTKYTGSKRELDTIERQKMLPFLKKKRPNTILMNRTDDRMEILHQEGALDHGLISAAEELIHSIHAKDVERTASALKAAFEISDSMPHIEGEHTDEE